MTPASYYFTLDKPTLTNSGSDKVSLTVTVLNGLNNPMSGVPVSVSPDTGVYTPLATSTGADGSVSGAVSIGSDKTNRNINATITVNGVAKVVTIPVVGSQISVTPVPATPAPGALVTLNIKAGDALGTGIATQITLSGVAGLSSTSITTDISGNATATFTAPAATGSYTVTAQGLGVSSSKIVQVVVAGAGAIANATGPVSAASLSSNVAEVDFNTSGSSVNRAALTAKFLTTGSTPIANMRVRFELVAPTLGNGEVISTGDAIVYTNASGEAIADYIPGTRSSPVNGVTVRACYALTDAAIAGGACPSSVITTLTVKGRPLDISIGDDNLLSKGLGNISYIRLLLVQIVDSASQPVPGVQVSVSADITHFGKGSYVDGSGTYQVTGDVPPTIANTYTNTFSTTAMSSLVGGRVWCLNEDINRNGSKDVGEDINANGLLEPKKSEIAISFESGNKTDANGQLLLRVTYPQNVATWIAYTVKVTAGVEGSEGRTEKAYITNALEGDVENGSFRTPPYGYNRCIDPN
ncbi:MAG: hypothetical protein EON92_05185 [Burkholderiales bacterium]|nr:MAG: hypothetical protein EON92_05185 [Burkholderiales bacterium]